MTYLRRSIDDDFWELLDQRRATAIEYCFIAALVSVAAVVVAGSVGTGLSTALNPVANDP